MKNALFLFAILPFWLFSQEPEDNYYPVVPLDSTKPVVTRNAFSFGVNYTQRKVVGKDQYSSDIGYKLPKIDPFYSIGFRLGFIRTQNRFYFPVEVGINFFDINKEAESYRIMTNHLNNGDVTRETFTDHNYYQVREARLAISGGIGFHLFAPDSRFNIIPLIKAAPSYNIQKKTKTNYGTQSRDFALSGSKDSSSHSDTLFQSSGSSLVSANLDIMAGAIVSWKINPHTFLTAEYCFGVFSSSIIYNDKLSGYLSFSICYAMPRKTGYKPLKMKREREPGIEPEE